MLNVVFLLLASAVCVDVTTFATAQVCSKVTDFNAALLHRSKKYKERAPQIPGAILENDADYFCLQEVWLESDMEHIIEKVKGKYPYHYSFLHHTQGQLRKPIETSWYNPATWIEKVKITSACSLSDIAGMAWVYKCASKNGCLGTSDMEKQGACAAQACGDVIKSSMSQTCYQCYILMFTSKSNFLEACVPDPFESNNRFNSPGLMVLSKQPMKNVHYTPYWPDVRQAMERGYIQADIAGGVKTLCTHASNKGDHTLEYDSPLPDSFSDPQAAELRKLVTQFGAIDHLLMGDLNLGPTVLDSTNPEKTLSGRGEEVWNILLNSSIYKAPYFEQDGRCTHCKQNPLVDSGVNKVIDHILVNGNSISVPHIQRSMDSNQPPISDHYAVQAKVCTSQDSATKKAVYTN